MTNFSVIATVTVTNKTGNVRIRNIELCSCNQFCSGKAISSTYSECMFVTSVIQHVMGMRNIFICDLSGSTVCISPHYLINGNIFEKKRGVER